MQSLLCVEMIFCDWQACSGCRSVGLCCYGNKDVQRIDNVVVQPVALQQLIWYGLHQLQCEASYPEMFYYTDKKPSILCCVMGKPSRNILQTRPHLSLDITFIRKADVYNSDTFQTHVLATHNRWLRSAFCWWWSCWANNALKGTSLINCILGADHWPAC